MPSFVRDKPFAAACHPACVACTSQSGHGLGLRFTSPLEGVVEAPFACDPCYQGYPDRLHGGIVATLLDAAMTQFLFTQEIRAYTARMELRFRHRVRIGLPATVRAWRSEARGPLHRLEAEVVQQGVVCARASATFCATPAESD